MGLQVKLLTDLVIASSGTDSNVLGVAELNDAEKLIIYPPAALTGTVTVEVSQDNLTFTTLEKDGSDIAITAGKAIELENPAFRYMKVVSDMAEAAERTFQITKLIRDSRLPA